MKSSLRLRSSRASILLTAFVVFALEGLEAARPVSSFAATLNLPPAAPSNPSPADNSTNQGSDVTLQWQCSDPEGQALTFDVYLGTTNPPDLEASNFGSTRYNPVPRQFGTTYWWRIVARDASGAETSGPIWSFTTRNNSAPNVPAPVMPMAGQTNYPTTGQLKFAGSDPDAQQLVFDVYFGTDANPPLISSNEPYTEIPPGTMEPNTLHYWRVVARDTDGAERSSPTWSFTTGSGSNAPPLTPNFPTPPNGYNVTPRNPVLRWNGGDPDGNPLLYSVTVWADNYEYYHLTTTERYLAMTNLTKNITYAWKVEVTDGDYDVQGPIWTFHVSGGVVPVLFSKFDAKQEADGVRVEWHLSSDEPVDGFTLYRREGASSSRAVGEGKVVGDHGSYVDDTAQPGKTYQYELVIRTTGGDEFRSQTATVSMHALTLVLHQNVPNPFNPQTSIHYELPNETFVRLTIFDTSGRRIRTLLEESQAAGSHEVMWNGRDDVGNSVSSGVYFYMLDVGKERLTRKLVLLK
jgi:hypothetical protein